jgi:hypothetical protein
MTKPKRLTAAERRKRDNAHIRPADLKGAIMFFGPHRERAIARTQPLWWHQRERELKRRDRAHKTPTSN